MKDVLLLLVGGMVVAALFADGGVSFAPALSPALNVQYTPDQSTTTIESQTNIERQTVIYQAEPPAGNSPAGVNTRREYPPVALVDVGPGRCAVQPGDVVDSEQGNGACFVWNAGRKYFINPNGNRWEVDAAGQAPPNTVPAQSSTTIVTTTVLLAPDVPRTLPEMQAAFLRNGGQLPTLWSWRGEDYKMRWLSQQEETWR